MHVPLRVSYEDIPDTNPPLAVAYVAYREKGTPRVRTERISDAEEAANVDFDDTGAVVGIELIGVDAANMAVAARFAHEHGLGFPREITAATSAIYERLWAELQQGIDAADRGELYDGEEVFAELLGERESARNVECDP